MTKELVASELNESGKDLEVEIKLDSNGGRDAIEAEKQDAGITEKDAELSETRQTEEVTWIDDKILSPGNPSLAEPTSSTFDNSANPFALPGSQDTLALPSAAQPRRLSSPPLRSKSPAKPTSSSSSSSDDTITHTSRPFPHSRPNSTLPSPARLPFEEDDGDDGSEDSLMMKPLDSSATKSSTGGGAYRSRSTSVDPKARGDVSDSSPSRASRSPSMDIDIDIGNVGNRSNKQTSRRTKASTTSRDSRRPTSIASQSEREDDEDSADDMDLLAGTKPKKQRTKRRSSFLHVDVPPASSSRNSSTTISKRSSQQPASPRHSPTVSTRLHSPEDALDGGSGTDDGGKKRRRREHHGYDIVVESGKTRSPSPRQCTAASKPQTQSSRESHSVSPPPLSNPLPASSTQPHPLSEIAFDAATQDTVVHSSPLSSVPASTPAQRPANSSPSQPITVKRRLASNGSDIEAEASAAPNTDTSSPKKKARVPKVTVKDMNPPPVPSSSSTVSKITRRPVSRVKPKKKEVASEPAVEEEDKRDTSEAVVGNTWAVRPKRKKSNRQTMREDSSEEAEGSGSNEESEEEIDKDVYSSPAKKRRASVVKKVKPRKASPRASTAGKGTKKDVFKPESRLKGKGKGKAQATSEADEEMPVPSSSPAKTSLRPASSFMLQLSQAQSSTRETAAERAERWDVRTFDEYIWVHVEEEEGKGGFWWPGRITNKLRSERPLLVELFVDPDRSVLDNSPDPVISIDEPSPDNLLQFRSRDKPSKMRFTKETFRDIPTSPASAIPDDAFDAVLQDVLKLERSFGSDDDSEESDDLPDPSQLGTSQRSKKSTQGKRPASSDKESEAEGDAVKPSDSDEDLLKEDEEIDKYPFYCLAKVKSQWWPATCVGPALNVAKGKKQASKRIKKYKIEYSDGSKDDLARNALLLARQRDFHTVRVEQYEIPIIPGYLENAIKFIKDRCSKVLQQLLNETYPPAQFRNDHFYAGGPERENLAKSVVYGELTDEQTEAISGTILEWLRPETGERPKGSLRYEALTDSERVTYVADVLLPVAIVLNYVDDRFDEEPNIEGKAREALGERGNVAPTDDEVDLEIYGIAYKELNTRSAAKAIASMREGRRVALASKASKKKRK